jgi:GTP-binding protein
MSTPSPTIACAIHDAKFIYGADSIRRIPETDTPQIAFIGRSNVGKSSFINRVLGRKNLVRTSRTPGCTRKLNFFEVAFTLAVPFKNSSLKQTLHFVDLPGFGYAKTSIAERNEFSKNIVDFIVKSEKLKIVFLLNDIRRDPGEDELSIVKLLKELEKVFFVITTKCDKETKFVINKRVSILTNHYGLTKDHFLTTGNEFSSSNFWEKIHEIFIS